MSSGSASSSASPPSEDNVLDQAKENDNESVSVTEKGKEKEVELEPSATSTSELQDSQSKDNSKEENIAVEPLVLQAPGSHTQGDWQAIWSPQHNTYYFYNSQTGETTWNNPLVTSTSAQPELTSQPQHNPFEAALAAGIDPELAFLDPNFALPSQAQVAGGFQARFNARTGAFTKMDARDPSHLHEWERMKRMSDVYFDTEAYEREVQRREEEEAAESRKKRKVTKKDLERFKEQKRLKKIAKTAWLRT